MNSNTFILSNKIKIVLPFLITIKFKTTKKLEGGGGKVSCWDPPMKNLFRFVFNSNFYFQYPKNMDMKTEIKYNFFFGYLLLSRRSSISLAHICSKVWVTICNTSIISFIVSCNTNTRRANFTCWTLEWWMKDGIFLK